MDQKYVNSVTSYLQQKLADAVMEAANLAAQLREAMEKISELEAGPDAEADASK